MEKEKSRKIKNKMRLERSGDGDTCVEEKKQEKKRKEKEKKCMDARKESKKNKKNKKSQLNVTTIFL